MKSRSLAVIKPSVPVATELAIKPPQKRAELVDALTRLRIEIEIALAKGDHAMTLCSFGTQKRNTRTGKLTDKIEGARVTLHIESSLNGFASKEERVNALLNDTESREALKQVLAQITK